jgi:hypothetical protein
MRGRRRGLIFNRVLGRLGMIYGAYSHRRAEVLLESGSARKECDT